MSESFKYVKEFEFPSAGGFSASSGKTMVKGYARGGSCGPDGYAKGGKMKAKDAIRNEREEMSRIKRETRSERKDAGEEMSRVRKEMRVDEAKVARKGYPPARREPLIPMMSGGMLKPRGKLGIEGNKNPDETKMHTAPDLPRPKTMMKKGGMTPKQEAKGGKVMGEYKAGELHSGSKEGPKVRNRKQAVAIALSEARDMKKK